jgi:hypothetical protein
MYWSPGGANSTLICATEAPSSSASNMGSAVYTPWPISDLSQKNVMLLSVPMRNQALGSMKVVSPAAAGFLPQPGKAIAISRPPEAAAVVLRKARRETESITTLEFADMVSSPETSSMYLRISRP